MIQSVCVYKDCIGFRVLHIKLYGNNRIITDDYIQSVQKIDGVCGASEAGSYAKELYVIYDLGEISLSDLLKRLEHSSLINKTRRNITLDKTTQP